MSRSVVLVLLGTTLAGPAVAQRADLPPAAVVGTVLDSHPSVEAATARIDAARAEARMLRKGPHEVTVSGSYLRRSVDREGGYDEFDTTVSRAIRLPGKAALDREAGRLGVEVAQNRQEDVRHQTSLLLSDRWHDWQLASALARLDTEAVAGYTRELNAVRDREQVRDASALDVDQVQSALALAQAQLADTIAQREQARAALAANFPGLPLPAEAPALSTPALPEASLEQLRALIIARSHEIRAAEREADRLSVVGTRVRRERFADPSIGVRLFSERSGMERGAGLVASIPFGGGYRTAAADQAAAQAHAARFEAASMKREIAAIADGDVIAVRSRLDAWEAADRAAKSADGAVQRSARGYQLGASDLTDMLYARRQALDAARIEVRARAEALRAAMKISIDSHIVWAPDDE